MLEIAIMIEGQDGLNWPRWKAIANLVEKLGFVGLYRSDHYTNGSPPDKDSLELWTSLTWLASHTSKIEFGPLVSPVSFRDPTMTARIATAIDDLSGGRLHLGLGAGWQEREHTNFGWDLLEIPERFARFEEGLEVVTGLLNSDTPIDFQGEYYSLKEAIMFPRPQRPGGPPIVIGGNGPIRTLPLVAKYAVEWNGVYLTPEKFKERSERLDQLLFQAGRGPSDIKRSLMTGVFLGYDDAEVKAIAASRNRTPEEMRELGVLIGTKNQIVDQLGELSEAGVYRVMLQWLDQEDLERLEKLAEGVLAQV